MRAHRIGAAAYLLWGVVHLWVGWTIITLAGGAASGGALRFQTDARTADVPDMLTPAMVAVLRQHGWNLLWIGGLMAVLAVGLFRTGRPSVAWLALAIGGLADIGYLWALVLPGFVKPQTWIGGPTLWAIGAALTIPLLVTSRQAGFPNQGRT